MTKVQRIALQSKLLGEITSQLTWKQFLLLEANSDRRLYSKIKAIKALTRDKNILELVRRLENTLQECAA